LAATAASWSFPPAAAAFFFFLLILRPVDDQRRGRVTASVGKGAERGEKETFVTEDSQLDATGAETAAT